MTPEEVRQALKFASADLSPTGADWDYGAGRVNAVGSVALTSVLESKIMDPADGTAVTGPTTISGIARGAAHAAREQVFGVLGVDAGAFVFDAHLVGIDDHAHFALRGVPVPI